MTQLALEALKHPVIQTVEENYEEKVRWCEILNLAFIIVIPFCSQKIILSYVFGKIVK